MAKDWFEANAPKTAAAQTGGDWFEKNAPGSVPSPAASASAPATPSAPFTGGAVKRFLSSGVKTFVEPIKGMYHGVVEGPQNPEEAAVVAANPYAGRGSLILNRFIFDPMKSEAHRTAEEFRQSDPWSLYPSSEAKRHRELALAHGVATITPGVGPAAVQAGERIKEQADAGDTAGALGTLAGTLAQYAAPEALGRVARSRYVTQTRPFRAITKMIRPMAEDVRFGKDPVRAILDEGIVGNTLEEIGEKASEKMSEVGKKLDAKAKDPAIASKVVDLSGALQPLDQAMAEAAKAGDQQLFAKLLATKDELANNWKPFRSANGEITLRKTGPRTMKMSPPEALKFKRMVGDRIRWTKDPLDGAVNKTLSRVWANAKDEVNDAVPGLEELNEKYSDLVGATMAIRRRVPIANRNPEWSLTDVVLAGTGHIPLTIAKKVFSLPAIRSRAAQVGYRLPQAVPKYPGLTAAPLIGAASTANRKTKSLAELKAEAEKLKPAPSPAYVPRSWWLPPM
jgi:hypothetical protein